MPVSSIFSTQLCAHHCGKTTKPRPCSKKLRTVLNVVIMSFIARFCERHGTAGSGALETDHQIVQALQGGTDISGQ
jgi:hypothetical protein